MNLSMKTGRNESCPCGSGLKYKKCCLPKEQDKQQKRIIRERERYRQRFLESQKEYREGNGPIQDSFKDFFDDLDIIPDSEWKGWTQRDEEG